MTNPRPITESFRHYAAGIAFLAVAFLAVKVTLLVDVLEPKILTTTENVDRTVAITGAAMRNLELATRSMKNEQDAEYQQIQAVSVEVAQIASGLTTSVSKLNSTLDSLNALTEHTDRNMGSVEKDADTAIKNVNPALTSLNAELDKLQPLTENLTQAVAGLPPIEKNATDITANTAKVTADLAKLSDHYTKQILKPVTEVKVVSGFVWNSFLRFAGAAIGVKF